jgi:predicted dehydrogenase
MPPTYTAAVIGGGSGGQLSLAALAASSRFELVALADLRAEVRSAMAARYPGLRTFATHQELLAACPIDVLCVATYAPTHAAVALEALAGPLRGILVEKPLAPSVAEASRILDAVQQRAIPVVVPHGLLVARHGQEVLRLVREGAIGALRLVEIESDQWDIINAGIHWLNYFVALTEGDPVAWVQCACDSTTRTYRDGFQVETAAVTSAQTRGGVRVVMHTGDEVAILPRGKGAVFRLVGEAGLIEFWGWESRYRIVNAEHPGGAAIEVSPNARSGHQIYLEQLAEQIDASAPSYTDAARSLAALELCEAAYRSDAHRCAVRLPLTSFRAPAAQTWAPGEPYAGSGGGRDGRQLPQRR